MTEDKKVILESENGTFKLVECRFEDEILYKLCDNMDNHIVAEFDEMFELNDLLIKYINSLIQKTITERYSNGQK